MCLKNKQKKDEIGWKGMTMDEHGQKWIKVDTIGCNFFYLKKLWNMILLDDKGFKWMKVAEKQWK